MSDALEQVAAAAAAQSTTESGIETMEQVMAPPSPPSPTISAKDALGLDESPRESLKDEQKKLEQKGPKETMPRDENGRFVNPKKGAKAPAAPAAPKVTEPAKASEPAKPAPAPEPAKPASPPKVKIGDKEYTTEELAKILEQRAQPQQAPAPKQEAPPAPKEPTPEELAQMEADFIAKCAADIADAPITEEALEKVLVGGKEGVAALQGLLKHVAARSILEARKSIYGEMNPVLQQFAQQVTPLIQSNQQLEVHATEVAFTHKYPEYSGENLNTARYVAQELARQFPQQVSQMTREQFIDEVNRQADKIISDEFKRWYPGYSGTWREWQQAQKAQQAAPAAAAPVATPAPAPKAAAPAANPAPAKKPAAPPAANSPGAVTGAPRDWQKGVAGSLIG